jgi:hypothetical protein
VADIVNADEDHFIKDMIIMLTAGCFSAAQPEEQYGNNSLGNKKKYCK